MSEADYTTALEENFIKERDKRRLAEETVRDLMADVESYRSIPELLEKAAQVLTPEAVGAWLFVAMPSLGDVTPLQLMRERGGVAELFDYLDTLDEGGYE